MINKVKFGGYAKLEERILHCFKNLMCNNLAYIEGAVFFNCSHLVVEIPK